MRFWRHKWLRRLMVWVLLPVVLGVGFYHYNYPTCTFRYKLTAEVMTPQGLKTGSSVIEVSYSSVHPFPNPGRWSADTITGEAVYVDLGTGKNLFVMLGADRWERKASRTPSRMPSFDGVEGGDDAQTEEHLGEGSLNALWLPVHVFKLGRTVGQEREMQRRANALLGQAPVEVPLVNLPMLGTFANLAFPQTFDTVLPREINKVFREGYALQSVKLQMVDENAEDRVSSVLPSLSANSGALLVKSCSGKVANPAEKFCRVYSGSFKLIANPHIGMF